MLKKSSSRRQFLGDTLKLAGASAAAGLLPASILRAQSIPAASGTGTIQDVKHIVILMQENRSFDHYLGNVPAVRGFGDPRPAVLQSTGYPVWYQPGGSGYVLPFRPAPSSSGTNGDTYFAGLDHGWAGGHSAWNGGQYNNWVSAKTRQTMAYFTNRDIPYYYALANAFTVCDAYHCSLLGPTNPNRLYMFTGCCGNIPGYSVHIDNNTYGAHWTTLPERLNAAGITWKFYQDKGQGLSYAAGFGERTANGSGGLSWNGNYGDNTLLNFSQYQNLQATSPLAPALNGTQIDPQGIGKPYDMGLFAQLIADVANNTLPQVSWIAAPVAYCEHPSWATSGGEWYVSNVLNALTSNPDVWARTVLFITYDENDGYFDHVPPPVPPASGAGKSNVSTATEFRDSSSGSMSDGSGANDQQIGLGVRVPMLAISPWSKGGKVNSQVFDHTSIIRFIEARFANSATPLSEPNISAWRRAVCGDLTTAFDFSHPDQRSASLGTASSNMDPSGSTVSAAPPSSQALPALSAGRRVASRLPYEFFAEAKVDPIGKTVNLSFTNTGSAGVSLQLRRCLIGGSDAPRHYTIAQDSTQRAQVKDASPFNSDNAYDLAVYGPNGYLHELRGNGLSATAAEVRIAYDVNNGNIRITIDNTSGMQAGVFMLSDTAYRKNPDAKVSVGAGANQDIVWYGDIGWYDVSIRLVSDVAYFRRFAGCVQPLSTVPMTDSAIGNTAQFVPNFSVTGTNSATLRFDYVAPPWLHSPTNWIGVYKKGGIPSSSNGSLAWVRTPKSSGSVMLASRSGNKTLASGNYDLYFLFNDGYTVLSGPIPLTI
ncbi:phospholipase C, phosphocholine-specific [Caballeronia sp. LZ065]|uniref:phosphocholine-specific phospholipase C n=1 Tax=Caballeronia sp. LZ065 TaxID=3038571 RepID=UPI00286021EC|nr:phospholipase C, phosphocholine-specific [Caballeronia sp. LZ065]MDR5783045.1 phospholipase C, phosphocholine-specific [Caballeronia sp. LZ065]